MSQEKVQDYSNFLNDTENKKKAFLMAVQIKDCVGKNWFNLSRALVKTKQKDIATKLQVLGDFGLVEKKIGAYEDGLGRVGDLLYKIVLSDGDVIEAIDDKIKYHESIIEKLKLEREHLASQSA